MQRVCLLEPYRNFIDFELSEKFIIKKYANLKESLRVAMDFYNNGGEIIITRGGTANIIRENTPLTVIEIEVSSLEILKTLKKIENCNIPLGIVGYKNAVQKCSYLAGVVGFEERYELIVDEDKSYDNYIAEIEDMIYNKKIKVFIGDTVLLNVLEKRKYYIDFYLIKSDPSSIYKTFEEAKKLLKFKDDENLKNKYLTAMLNNTDCGIVYTDENGIVNHYNLVANKIFCNNISKNSRIYEIIPELDSDKLDKIDDENKNMLVTIEREQISMDITPIYQDDIINSFLFTLRKLKNIEESANRLRKSLRKDDYTAKYSWGNLITKNKDFEQIKKIAKVYAKTDNTILITGESGTGKELIAQSIHNSSMRKKEPFIAFNCANISENLIESELFGYEEGAFTGAKKNGKKGLFELADNGTIFLDEISEIPYHLQNKFLRVLQEKSFRRVGGEETIYVDIRVIAATNKNLKELCELGKFRRDLFYRLNVLELGTIPLRERPEDIVVIGEHFLEKEMLSYNLFNKKDFSEILLKLKDYTFPGNVRELENFIKRIVVLKSKLGLSDREILNLLPLNEEDKKIKSYDNLTLREIEQQIVEEILREEGNNKTRAAVRLGIDRGTLGRILSR
ncbi:Anaerobic nitric oxide reductase transcription regulator NorR [Fusobacterium sp. DD29]|uniref:sigma 54-interacting transcriptional regulator n=1 Tax=unclassified Fusobacterium TaxID=2648384 RepID=UPI001B8B74C4|nr:MULTISPECIES: sigma 54-interacting transcriptional regulator [unclassified Fusobacterium]MBR8700895.1 Anaerobic nitric oxide reductase transcription regulator NorR [Fusobacterium sp. DD45]MBR8710641.1 Anaerobic nitric oxide reductase transcription regulator NorR [Fusobacterium sp. DD28]MBR8748820.1 Anaerobic nitric oxide reductase transcription regulator NorR [Fusobacterium sp. DD29]MBR8751245.1 Anaerobic nitric oxide reductase transcription regulator NorR [Fusobacterium sp. DD26]MBR8761087